MSIYVELLVAVVGLILYVIAKDAKMQEIGRILFFCGMLAFLVTGAPVLAVLHK